MNTDRLDQTSVSFGEQWWNALSVNVSGMRVAQTALESDSSKLESALAEMSALEAGEIANKDEERMVGHYWLRDSTKAPYPEIKDLIDQTLQDIELWCEQSSKEFTDAVVIGIGGSSLGIKLIEKALLASRSNANPKLHYIDNTDPQGIADTLCTLSLKDTLVFVISKSGGTRETYNGMIEVEHAYTKAGLSFPKHAVAITGDGSKLYKKAFGDNWRKIFPIWDWVGGRTSVMSAVGLVPLTFAGVDSRQLLYGAKLMDAATRSLDLKSNPAVLLAYSWYYVGNARGDKAMVALPYNDSLEFLARYLQQLVMESIGKKLDRDGAVVHQGLTVYGNKGSTDQHAFVQQLRDGRNDFFTTFIEVLKDRSDNKASLEIEPGITSGDYLAGFLYGTRQALAQEDRVSTTITLPTVDAQSIGALIALFERAVGLYASLINVNAYHQPGVEAGKIAANEIIELQKKIVQTVESGVNSVAELQATLGEFGSAPVIKDIYRRLVANGRIELADKK